MLRFFGETVKFYLEHCSQPTLPINRFAFETQLQGFTARLNAELRDVWITAKLLCEGNAFSYWRSPKGWREFRNRQLKD